MKIKGLLLFNIFIFTILTGTKSEASVKVSEFSTYTEYQILVDGWQFDKIILNNILFDEIKLKGVSDLESIRFELGNPDLPVLRLVVDGNVSVVVAGESEVAGTAGRLLKPVQPSLEKIRGATREFHFNQAVYQQDQLSPSKRFLVESIGRNQKMLTLYPVAYNPVQNKYEFRSSFTVRVEKVAPPQMIVDRRTSKEKDIFVMVAGSQFKNSPSLDRLVKFKKRLGYEVQTIIFGERIKSPEDLRKALQEIFHRTQGQLKYVILIGDQEDVPGKPSDIIKGVTDHYYRVLKTSNYKDGLNDPDIGLGRFAVSNEMQLSDVVDKNIAYEIGQFKDTQWLDQISFLATNDKWELAEGTHNYVIQNHTSPLGYWGIFPEKGMKGGDQLYAVTHKVSNETVHEAMQEGRTVINYSGHGAITYWDSPGVTQEDVKALKHGSALPFVISNACITGDFRTSESFAETWQRHPQGSIVFWGSMDSTYWDEDDILEKRMYDGIYDLDNMRFSELTDYALKQHWKHYGGVNRSSYYWETYVLFGDPSVALRTSEPEIPVIEGNLDIPFGSPQASFLIRSRSGEPLKNARVIFRDHRMDTSMSAQTDHNGEVQLELQEAVRDPGKYELVIQGKNTQLASSYVTVFPPDNMAFVRMKGMLFNQRSLAKAEPGETLTMSFNLQNIGGRPTEGGKIFIESIEGPAEAFVPMTKFEALKSGQASSDRNPGVQIEIDENASVDERIRLVLAWETLEGYFGKYYQTIDIARAVVSIASVDFGVPGNSEIGGIPVGGEAMAYLTIQNTGNSPLNRGVGILNPGECLADLDASIALRSLAPQERRRLAVPIRMRADPACKSGDLVSFQMTGRYQGARGEIGLFSAGHFPLGVIQSHKEQRKGLELPILDNQSVEVEIEYPNIIQIIKSAKVHLRLKHSYIGDLEAKLVHPDGTEVILHNREGSGTDDINVTYGSDDNPHPGLSALKGKSGGGIWKLIVSDNTSSDQGILEGIDIELVGY